MSTGEVVKLAQESAVLTWQVYSQQLSGVNTKLEQALVQSAGDVSRSIDQDVVDRGVNLQIINKFGQLLPQISHYSNEYSDVMTWHKIRASIIFHGSSGRYPIGYQRVNHSNAYMLLLNTEVCEPKYATGEPVKKFWLRPSVMRLLEKEIDHRFTTEPTDTELGNAYDPKGKKFVFSDVSDGVFRTTELDSVKNAWLNGAAATWVIEHTVDSNFSAARSFKKGHLIPVIEQGASRFEEYGPSNLQMANFRVFEHLATLATRFGIVQQYCDILGEAGVDVATVATESVDASSSDSTENLQ